MKGLTLYQPYATLVADSAKHFETRGWKTSYRGEIAIHSAMRFPKDCAKLCLHWPFNKYIQRDEITILPFGCIVAVVILTEIITTWDWIRLYCARGRTDQIKEEYSFGDYSPSRFAWKLEMVRKLAKPVPCKGNRMLWNVPVEIEAQVQAQLT